MVRIPRFTRLGRRPRSHRSRRERRTIATLAVLGGVCAVAGISLLASGATNTHHAKPARSTTTGYGEIPNAGAPVTGPSPQKEPFGLGEFCDTIDQLNRTNPVAEYAYKLGDLGLLRATLADEVGVFDNLAARAPVEIRAGMQQLATDAHTFVAAVQKAATIADVQAVFKMELPPIFQRNTPTSQWIKAHCPKVPTNS